MVLLIEPRKRTNNTQLAFVTQKYMQNLSIKGTNTLSCVIGRGKLAPGCWETDRKEG